MLVCYHDVCPHIIRKMADGEVQDELTKLRLKLLEQVSLTLSSEFNFVILHFLGLFSIIDNLFTVVNY